MCVPARLRRRAGGRCPQVVIFSQHAPIALPVVLPSWRPPRADKALSPLLLGLKQEQAYEESQKYKEGKYIVEKVKVYKVCDCLLPAPALFCGTNCRTLTTCSACGAAAHAARECGEQARVVCGGHNNTRV